MSAYYNEIDPYAAQWLRNLIAAGHIAPGDVDERSIVEVQADDLRGYTQCHFFAGIGGWSYALRLAGWSDDRPVWTGSCPCQPFSLAGKQRGFDDERHLWPVWYGLIKERRPAKVFGEQVASAADWLRLVRSDMEALGYAVGAMPVQAASAGADHLRDRYWFVADADDAGSQGRSLLSECAGQRPARPDGVGDVGVSHGRGPSPREQAASISRYRSPAISAGGDSRHEWVIGADGKSRRVKSGIRLLAHGVPARVGKLRAFGNAIDPRPAAAFIQAASEVAP
jgi:DNA (cytosine-5)-methyltransferase 1